MATALTVPHTRTLEQQRREKNARTVTNAHRCAHRRRSTSCAAITATSIADVTDSSTPSAGWTVPILDVGVGRPSLSGPMW
jgi:hypothetical protein